LTQNEADELAKKSGLTPEFHTVGQEHKIERVIKQEPKAKSRWTKDIKGVQLYLG
jgi:hypothetical protein